MDIVGIDIAKAKFDVALLMGGGLHLSNAGPM